MKILMRTAGIIYGIMCLGGLALMINNNDVFWLKFLTIAFSISAVLSGLLFIAFAPNLKNKELLLSVSVNYRSKSDFWHNSHIIFFSIATALCFALGSYLLGIILFINTLGFGFEKYLGQLIKQYQENA